MIAGDEDPLDMEESANSNDEDEYEFINEVDIVYEEIKEEDLIQISSNLAKEPVKLSAEVNIEIVEDHFADAKEPDILKSPEAHKYDEVNTSQNSHEKISHLAEDEAKLMKQKDEEIRNSKSF